MFERPGYFSPLLHARRLTQDFIVDLYICVEQSRIRWVRRHQKSLKAEMYQGVLEAFEGETNLCGRTIVLPSSFQGEPRHMQQMYHDAMALVRELGEPSLFITMIANPQWLEIQHKLKYGEVASDQPDLVSRVFYLKLKEVMKDLTKSHLLGRVVSFLYTIKFQKRGLPHAHILLILDTASTPRTAREIDAMVSAQPPDVGQEPRLYEMVTSFMLHGPCAPGRPCWQNDKCCWNYPKAFVKSTTMVDDSYPAYSRPNNGLQFIKGHNTFNNAHVVP